MPNNNVFRRPFIKRGQNWLPPTKPPLANVTGSGGLLVGGAATIGYGQQVGSIVATGGIEAGGSADKRFVHAGQATSDIVVEWDLDNDGDFSETVEDITPFVMSAETFTGRDWPSLLTGRAGPGKLRASLRNDDDRFNFFNASSPLVTAPYSLHTGRRVRVRTSSATNPDPAPLVKDRFRRAAGALDEDEFGNPYIEPLANDFVISARRAVATSEGDPHMALIDTGSADYYVQTKIPVMGTAGNRVGLVYRYVDADNYSLAVIDTAESSLQLLDVVGGGDVGIASLGIEVYSGVTLGVLVSGSSATAYVEGVPLISGAATNGTAELAGLYAEWAADDDRPELDEFFAWDGIPVTATGVLWTGDVADLVSSVHAGPEKAAMLSGEGWLSKLPAVEVTPPTSVTGRKTGLLLGNVLARALLLHPPGTIAEGDITTGVFAAAESSALQVARDVEETELGFLYETQEGYVSFLSRSHRDGSVSRVTFSDATDAQFGYHRLEPYDWRKEVFNRVLAGISPWSEGEQAVLFTDPGPYILEPGESVNLSPTYNGLVARWTGHTRTVGLPDQPVMEDVTVSSGTGTMTTLTVDMPPSVTANDLLFIVLHLEGNGAPAPTVPSGFTETSSGRWMPSNSVGRFVTCAKVASGSEGGSTVQFTGLPSSAYSFIAHVYRVSNFYGVIGEGILIGTPASVASQSDFTSVDPPAVTPAWGAEPTLYVAVCGALSGDDVSVTAFPSGYSNTTATDLDAANMCLGTASRIASVSTENPSAFSVVSINFGSGMATAAAATIAIRGGFASTTPVSSSVPTGPDPAFTISYDAGIGGSSQSHSNIEVSGVPLVQGAQSFAQVDDYDSQDEHNAIRTYQNSANLFANAADAETYAQLVLATYADDRPIVSMSFYASKSPAYRKQAYTRRVGDRITLVANHNTGFGISRDFFIESISHRWSHGTRLWETTWELSPAE